MNQELLNASHPYYLIDPFAGENSYVEKVPIGGDRPVVKIFWGDESVDSNSTVLNTDDNASWDYVLEINGSNPVGLGDFSASISGLELDKQYFFRGYAQNLGGEVWAPNIETFIAMDTTFTEHTMEGMVLWLDARILMGTDIPIVFLKHLTIWIDKSLSRKNAQQSVAQKMPNYSIDGFDGLPAVRFESGDAFNIGSLASNYGNIHVFVVSKGTGVAIGATDGITGWSVDAKVGNVFSIYKSESNTLQQVSIGFDPSTGYGMLIGEIAEIMVFDRTLSKSEQEKIEGYLAHKWGLWRSGTDGFKLTKGLRLYYPFDETDGSVAQTIRLRCDMRRH